LSGPTQETKDVALAELNIGRYKKELDDLLTRFYEEQSGDPQSLWRLRASLAQASLDNSRELSTYVRKTSPAAANELDLRRRTVSRKLRAVVKSQDLALLQTWFKEELAPLLNKTEQAAYLVASAARRGSGAAEEHFTWEVGEPPGGEEHIRRFGKAATEFKYLNQTCPICGGRIDEMGWCGCGNIGGG
jgi:hypothetical protein